MLKKLTRISAALALAVTFGLTQYQQASAAPLSIAKTSLISASPSGEPSTNTAKGSYGTVMSSNGRYVAFTSKSTNLIAGVEPENRQTFLYDRLLRTMEIVSLTNSGDLGDSESAPAGVSDNGRYVVFNSSAANISASAGGTAYNVYIRDRQAHHTSLAGNSTYDSYAQPHSVSRDGNIIGYLAVTSQGGPAAHVVEQAAYVFNRTTHTTTALPGGSQPLGYLNAPPAPSVSGNGRYVTYGIVGPTQPSGLYGMVDNYRYDLTTSTSTLIETGAQGGVVLSNDGNRALYYLVTLPASSPYIPVQDLYFKDLTTGTSSLVVANAIDQTSSGDTTSLSISDDYSRISYRYYDNTAGGSSHVRNLSSNTDIVVTGVPAQGFITLSSDGQLVGYDATLDAPDSRFQAYVAQFASDAPIVTLVAPQANTSVSGTVSLDSSIISGLNYSHIFYVFNSASQIVASHYQYGVNASIGSLSYSWDTTTVPNGTYKVFVSAKDSANHKDVYSTDYYYVTVAN